MNRLGTHQKCQNGDDGCTGPGCRKFTGKTKRKQNWLRPKPNQHEGTRIVATQTTRRK